MMLDIALANGWLSLILSVIAVAGVLKGVISSGAKENAADIAKLKTGQLELTTRLQGVEKDINHLPDKDAVQRLQLGIERLDGHLNTMSAQLKPVAAISERLQEVLLENARK